MLDKSAENPNVFDMLVKYHVKENLASCLPHIRSDGKFYPPGMEKPLPECCENEYYRGFLLISVSDRPIDEFLRDLLVEDSEADPFVDISDNEEFFKYISGEKEKDGAHVLDIANKRVARVSEINNGLPAVDYSKILPSDFIHYGAEALPEKPRSELGTKTPLAIKLPHKFPGIETYVIKKTAYGSLGMGKVVHFSGKLVEELFFEHEPNAEKAEGDEPDLAKYADIMAVYKRYAAVDGGLICVEETRTPVADMYAGDLYATDVETSGVCPAVEAQIHAVSG